MAMNFDLYFYQSDFIKICKKIYLLDNKYFTSSEKYSIITTFSFCYLSITLKKISLSSLSTLSQYIEIDSNEIHIQNIPSLNKYGVVICKLFINFTEQSQINIPDYSIGKCPPTIINLIDVNDECFVDIIKNEYDIILKNYSPIYENNIQLKSIARLSTDVFFISVFGKFLNYVLGIIDAVIPI